MARKKKQVEDAMPEVKPEVLETTEETQETQEASEAQEAPQGNRRQVGNGIFREDF